MSQIRDLILLKMQKSGLTVYQVSLMVKGKIPQRTVYAFLKGEKDTTTETAEIIMNALGIVVTSESEKITFEEGVKKMEENQIRTFIDDDNNYLRWLMQNPSGFVVNSNKTPSPKYLILHTARCNTIYTLIKKGGDWKANWTKDYRKSCSSNKAVLEEWAKEKIKGKLQRCPRCKP